MASTHFNQFLSNYKTLKTGAFTHTSLGEPVGSFYIPIEREDEFYKLYSLAVKSGDNLYLTEKHKNLSPILLDFDFRYHIVDKLERIYTNNHLTKIVQIYVKILNDYYDTENIKIYLFEKENPTLFKDNEDIAKDGIHIIIPEIATKPSIQYIVRQKFLEEIKDLFNEIGFTNSADNIVDEAVIERNNWLMYGSTKPGCQIYKITKTYQINQNEVKNIPNVKMNLSETIKLFSIRNKYNEKNIKIEKKFEVDNYENRLNKQKRNKEIFLQATNKYPSKMNQNHYDNIDLVSKFVDILNPKRAEEYDLWIRLGWCLKTIDEQALDIWVKFSKKSDKYADGECEKLWDRMKEVGLGIGTLRMWAKEDNPKAYEDVTRQDWRKYLNKAISKSDYDLAEVVYHMFKYDYKCSSIKDNRWYQFRNHRWEDIDSAYTLRYHLSTDVVNEFLKIINEYTNQAMAENDPEEKQRYQDRAGKFMKVVNELKNTSKKNNIIKECSVLFYHEKFEDLLDSNVNLIGFRNGVYDLELLEFREGRPDDYISFTTGINYIEYNEKNPLNTFVMEFMNKVMPKPHLCDYIMKCLASFLNGRIKEEKFHIWIGTGCHSKDTPIRMYNGDIKMIQDIGVGEQLMGDDSTPRNVQRLWRGKDKMYEIKPVKGESFVVNGNHKLALKVTKCGNPNIYKKNECIIVRYKNDNRIKTKQFNTDDEAKKFIEINNIIKYTKFISKSKYKVNWLMKCSDTLENGMLISEKSKSFDIFEDAEKFKNELSNDDSTLYYNSNVAITINNIFKCKLQLENFCLYRVKVLYKSQNIPIDPYLLGYWLGDGHSQDSAITTMEPEVITYFEEKCADYNCEIVKNKPKYVSDSNKPNKAFTYRLVSLTKTDSNFRGKINTNKFTNSLLELNLWGNKHIPQIYKINDENARLQILAGIIDSDGHLTKNSSGSNNYEITLKNKQLLEDIVELARSLGFAAYSSEITKKCNNNGVVGTYYRTQIHGTGIDKIPSKLQRKQAGIYDKNRDPNLIGFKIIDLNLEDNYYGVEVDSNNTYLLDNYIATKNSNGKSKLTELYQKAFGDYCGSFNVSMLTQKRGMASGTNSELVKAKGKRFMILQEPSEKEKINVGLMKELTGGDKVQARGLYKEPIEFKPQFKLVLACNDLPSVPADDASVWRRVRVLQFISRFTDNPKHQYEFKLDDQLSEKFDLWAQTFMSILIKYYKIYLEMGITDPSEVTESTDKYRRENDCYSEFVLSRIEIDHKSSAAASDIYDEFKVYYQASMPSGRIPSLPEFKKSLEKQFGPVIRGRFRGVKLLLTEKKFDDSDDEENTEDNNTKNIEDAETETDL
jgi:P4 family phage/plasmid primase-like protien